LNRGNSFRQPWLPRLQTGEGQQCASGTLSGGVFLIIAQVVADKETRYSLREAPPKNRRLPCQDSPRRAPFGCCALEKSLRAGTLLHWELYASLPPWTGR